MSERYGDCGGFSLHGIETRDIVRRRTRARRRETKYSETGGVGKTATHVAGRNSGETVAATEPPSQ